MRMAKDLRKGDRVEWNTPQGKTVGTVKKKLLSATKIKKHEVKASKNDPQYLVESERSGKVAAHKPGSLTKKRKTKE